MIENSQETIIRTMTRDTNEISEEQRFALHHIDNVENVSFDRYAYSRYKYGDTRQAKVFGEELLHGFVNQYREFLLASKEEFLAISSPRGIVPPAAYYIFQVFLENLNRFLQANQRPIVVEHTIQRLGTLSEDYSSLSRHERFERLIDERYFIDRQPISNKFLLFVDDIRITGMHEMNIIRLLNTSQIYNRRLFLYYAQLVNEQIPSSFEHELNHCAMDRLERLLPIIHNPSASFQINTRVLKEILRANFSELHQFLHSITFDLLSQIYHASLACNYQSVEAFATNLSYLQHCFEQGENQEKCH